MKRLYFLVPNVGSARVKQFKAAIERGQLLMMVDVPRNGVDETIDMIRMHHREADARGVEPLIPAFP